MASTNHFRAPLPTEIPSQTKSRTTDQNSPIDNCLPDYSSSSLATRNNQPKRNDYLPWISNTVLARILWNILRDSTNLRNDSTNHSWLSIRKEAQAPVRPTDCCHDSKAALPIWTWKDRPSLPGGNAGEATFNILPARPARDSEAYQCC